MCSVKDVCDVPKMVANPSYSCVSCIITYQLTDLAWPQHTHVFSVHLYTLLLPFHVDQTPSCYRLWFAAVIFLTEVPLPFSRHHFLRMSSTSNSKEASPSLSALSVIPSYPSIVSSIIYINIPTYPSFHCFDVGVIAMSQHRVHLHPSSLYIFMCASI